MIWLTTTISTTVDAGMRLIQKIKRLGKYDIQTAPVAAPYGIDSNAVKNMIAVYADTSVKGQQVIVGYINVNSLAEVGGMRIFSTNDQGEEQFYVYLRASNNLELGGTNRHLARFEELESAFNQLKTDFDSHFHTSSPPGTPTTPPANPSTADISGAKIDNITVA